MARLESVRFGSGSAPIRRRYGHLRAPKTHVLQMVRSPPRATRHLPPSRFAVKRYARSQFSDDALHRNAITHAGMERGATADLLADLAEIDMRRFYLAMAYPSLFAYCLAELKLSEDAAYKRIKVARAARRFPVIFDAVGDGRLNLSGVCLLAPHLTEETAPELITAAMNQSNAEIEKLLAIRFPRPDVPAFVAPIQAFPPVAPAAELVVASVTGGMEQAPVTLQAARPVDCVERSIVKPLSPQRYEIHFSMSQRCHERLRYLQDLLGFEVPVGDLGRIFEDALDARIREVEEQRLAATAQPRRRRRSGQNPRLIPADVRRAVWARDGAQCTFVGDNGRRCQERKGLQFDHVLEVARGGEATVDGIRLLCRAHNQHAAERTFGVEFMRHKRIAAAEAHTNARAGS
jgi:5-methylcytosine-specific restriction endonuclease McrA